MKRFFRSEAGAVLVWLAVCLPIAAVLAPWLWHLGNWFAAENGDDRGGLAGWLARACARAKFDRYYNRCLQFGALVMLPLLLRRVRTITEWRRARGERLPVMAHPSWPAALSLFAGGAALACVFLLGLGLTLVAFGVFVPGNTPLTFGRVLSKVVVPATGASMVEEIVFRGFLLGWWLRLAKPVWACVGSSLLFAAMHFLTPSAGDPITHPGSPLAGFELLGSVLGHFANPSFLVADFLTLFGVGIVLAGARIRTGSLWLPVGLHFGWIFAFKAFHLCTTMTPDRGGIGPVLLGNNLREGLLPLTALLLTGVACHFLMKWCGHPVAQRKA